MKRIMYIGFLAIAFGSNFAVVRAQNLTIGSRGSDVTVLQQMLSSKGFLSVAPTGYFGSLTKAALAAWQMSVGISPASGYFGPISQARLLTGDNSRPSIYILPTLKNSALGNSVIISWNSQNAPVDSVVALLLSGSAAHAGNQIKVDLPSTGTYLWSIPTALPGDGLWTDDSDVQEVTSGDYQITAQLYSPKGGFGAAMIPPSQQLKILASTTSAIFKVVSN